MLKMVWDGAATEMWVTERQLRAKIGQGCETCID